MHAVSTFLRAAAAFFSALLLLVASNAAHASPVALVPRDLDGFSLCSSGTPFTLESLTYSPNPITAGSTLTITLSGALTVDVTDGAYVSITAVWLGITVLSENIDLCSSEGVSCPIAASNDASLTVSFALPSAAPAVDVALTANAYNADGTLLTCVTDSSVAI
ncbi:hypothetical protein HK405_010900 [Cladochytrium tenue]|nr:hypothetical protein HK405_010900 [Cladochytrium tenue]